LKTYRKHSKQPKLLKTTYSQGLELGLVVENARSSKNWIGPIQNFPAEMDR